VGARAIMLVRGERHVETAKPDSGLVLVPPDFAVDPALGFKV